LVMMEEEKVRRVAEGEWYRPRALMAGASANYDSPAAKLWDRDRNHWSEG
jgi:hypothetical protein